MAKFRSIPRKARFPSLRNVVMVDAVRGVLRVRKWPKKRGPPKSTLQKFWIDWFTQANLLAKYTDGATQALAIKLTKGSGLYPRDIILQAMRGRLYTWTDTTGWQWFPVAAIEDVSKTLDVLAQTIGSVLVRATDRWRDAKDGAIGKVLTHQGATDPPKWLVPTGAGGFGAGCVTYRTSTWSLPNAANTFVPFTTALYDTSGLFDFAAAPTKLTVPAGFSWARQSAYIEFRSNTTGYRMIRLNKNGNQYPGGAIQNTPASGDNWQRVALTGAWVPVIEGDDFELKAYQNSGSARNLGVTTDSMFHAVELA